jgi:hypothetical protein
MDRLVDIFSGPIDRTEPPPPAPDPEPVAIGSPRGG